jgi:hypothetical protein
MLRWLRSGWSALWGSRPYSVRSPLSVAAAVAALDADRATARTLVGMSTRGAGLRRVTGRVSADGVRLMSRTGLRNSFRPVLRARFTPVPDGCELTGSFAAPRPAKAFAILWLTSAVVLSLPNLGRADGPAGLAPLAVGLGMDALGLVVFVLSARLGLRDEEHLRGWVERHLRGAV